MLPSGGMMQATWHEGGVVSGTGELQCPEGSYHGEVRDDLPDGMGTMSYVGGANYRGSWRGGRPDGRGP